MNTTPDIDINTEIDRIINSKSNNPEELERLLCYSNSFDQMYNYFRYVIKRGYGGDMDPKVYWKYLRQAYTGSDNNRDGIPIIKTMFTRPWPHRECLMEDHEQTLYNALPNQVTIYRGMTEAEARKGKKDPIEYGISWTLKMSVAEFFAYQYGRNFSTNHMKKTTVERSVPKTDIVAYFSGRNEDEVIYIPTIYK